MILPAPSLRTTLPSASQNCAGKTLRRTTNYTASQGRPPASPVQSVTHQSSGSSPRLYTERTQTTSRRAQSQPCKPTPFNGQRPTGGQARTGSRTTRLRIRAQRTHKPRGELNRLRSHEPTLPTYLTRQTRQTPRQTTTIHGLRLKRAY